MAERVEHTSPSTSAGTLAEPSTSSGDEQLPAADSQRAAAPQWRSRADIKASKADVAPWRTMWRLRRFLAPRKGSIVLGVLLMFGLAGLKLLKPWPLKFVLDDILGKPIEGSTLYLLIGVTAALIVIAALEGLIAYLLVLFLNRAGRSIVFDLRSALFDHIHRLSLQFHSHRSTGDVLTRVTGDAKALKTVLTDSLAELVVSVVLMLGMAGILLWFDWQLALVAIVGAPFVYFTLQRFNRRIRELSRAERRREGALASVAHETLGAIRLTRVLGLEASTKARFEAESAASLESGYAAALTEQRFSWLIEIVAALVTAAALGFGVYRVSVGALTAGTLVVFIVYVRNFYSPLRKGVKHANKISRAAARMEHVVELLEIPEGVADLPGARPAPAFEGRISFRGVSFRYEEGQPILEDVDLTIPERRLTAIVGPTGAGKTTLTALIARLYDPSAGSISIDGTDIREYTLESLRAQISMVPQESVLFSTGIAENIAFGRPEATRAEIMRAAKAANAYDFVQKLPDGFDTVVGERGETLSGGQRQRITIARAILRDSPIIVLDEPLAGLDATAALPVMEALEGLIGEKTLVIITHDLALVRRADYTAFVTEGRIAEQGLPETLLDANGSYRRLYEEYLRRGDGRTREVGAEQREPGRRYPRSAIFGSGL